MLEEILRGGFALAHQRLGLILLDILWKVIWLAATGAALLLAAIWLGSGIQSIAWQDTGSRAINGAIAAILLREFWSANRAGIAGVLFAATAGSICAWFVLEAYARWRILNIACGRGLRVIGQPPATTFRAFLASRASKMTILASTAVILIPVYRAGAIAIAIVVFAGLAFFLTLVDTLIRADAVELMGTDLLRVIGLIGILLSFEILIAGSFAVILIAGFLSVARLIDAAAMLGLAAVAAVFLNILHSYLLLVRFSAVAIMRRNVVEV